MTRPPQTLPSAVAKHAFRSGTLIGIVIMGIAALSVLLFLDVDVSTTAFRGAALRIIGILVVASWLLLVAAWAASAAMSKLRRADRT